jgi:hypothetical protein
MENESMSTEDPTNDTASNDNEGTETVTASPSAAGKRAAKKASKKGKRKKRKGVKKAASKSSAAEPRKRMMRSFPASTFEEALTLPLAIQQFAAGQRVRRLTLFDNLQKSPESSWSRQLITNSTRYGLTSGSYNSDYLELTDLGRVATNQEADARQQLKARITLAVTNISAFNDLYEQLKGQKLPAHAVMRDYLLEKGYSVDEVSECVDTFILNVKYLGLLRTVAGAERLLTMEHVLEDTMPTANSMSSTVAYVQTTGGVAIPTDTAGIDVLEDWSKICFYITPIGEANSERRQHSDLFLSHIVEPAMEEFGLRVVRADHIAKAGMITTQIIEHVIKSRMAIADLSYHNANVFYELSLRHALGLPTVQIIRASDPIPFDLNQVRTIQIDTTSIYSLVPQLATYKSEIANQVRRALNDPEATDNPLTIFYPKFKTLQLPEGSS